MWGTIVKGTIATGLFAVVHSLLASRQVKDATERAVGGRHRNGLYRVFYIAQSFATLFALFAYLTRLPNKVVWELKRPLSWLARVGQAFWMLYAVWAAYKVGLLRITGLASVWAWLNGQKDIRPEPEAQGPASDEAGRLTVEGPFRWSRHPLNWAPVPIFWMMPRMTLRRLAFAAAGSVYLVIGSIHEEARLRAAYGHEYEAYQNSGIPFYVPWPDNL